MIDYSGLIQPEGIINILYKTLNHVDARLIDHGLRVAYIVYRMLSPLNVHSDKELQNMVMSFLQAKELWQRILSVRFVASEVIKQPIPEKKLL